MSITYFNHYVFIGDKEELNNLLGKIKESCEINYSSSEWLNNILNKFGLNEFCSECKCEIFNKSTGVEEDLNVHNGYCFYLCVETDNNNLNYIWDRIIKNNYPNVKYYVLIESSDNSVFINTDTSLKYFNIQYRVCASTEYNGFDELVPDIVCAYEYICDFLHWDFTNIKAIKNRLIKYKKKQKKTFSYNINKFKIS